MRYITFTHLPLRWESLQGFQCVSPPASAGIRTAAHLHSSVYLPLGIWTQTEPVKFVHVAQYLSQLL